MTIFFDENGNSLWKFYRKSYRKARWRKSGQRKLDYMLKCGYKSGLIGVI